MMAEDLQKEVLQGLKCKMCSNYMKGAIYTCGSGHSVCDKCGEDQGGKGVFRDICSCKAQLTKSRNFALESVAKRVIFPCVNSTSGCPANLTADECVTHELNCTFNRRYSCIFSDCQWKGNHEQIAKHWHSKKMHKPYGNTNQCRLTLENNKSFFNLVKAHDQLFWYEFRSRENVLYWSVRFIGERSLARNYYYAIVVCNNKRRRKKLYFSNYCQALDETMKKDNHVYGIAINFDTLPFNHPNATLFFQFLVNKCANDPAESDVPEGLLIDLGEEPEGATNATVSYVEYRIPRSFPSNENIASGSGSRNNNSPSQNQAGCSGASSKQFPPKNTFQKPNLNEAIPPLMPPKNNTFQKGFQSFPPNCTFQNRQNFNLGPFVETFEPIPPPRPSRNARNPNANRNVNKNKQPENKPKNNDNDCVIC